MNFRVGIGHLKLSCLLTPLDVDIILEYLNENGVVVKSDKELTCETVAEIDNILDRWADDTKHAGKLIKKELEKSGFVSTEVLVKEMK